MRSKEMQAGSRYTVRLPQGCRTCRQGAKLVLLVTGKCDTGCFYCPLSSEKRGKAVVFADEARVRDDEDILEEARSIGAKGTGITGGDPLRTLESVLRYIRLLKATFGEEHHIHLYTSTVDRQAFLRLQEAGLDELRLHPRLDLWSDPERIGLENALRGLSMDVGIEIPAIPGTEEATEKLIRYADRIGLAFVNLNELEFSETNYLALRKRGIDTGDGSSSSALGSRELARRMMRLDVKIPIHYCSSSFKDSVQLRNRLKRRARRIARAGDLMTPEGTLLKGVIDGTEAKAAAEFLRAEFDVPKRLMHFDAEKDRLEVASWVLQEISGQLPFDSYIVEEYPTADRLEVERERLPRKKGKRR
ncbi:MAG: radical SAM protein [Methanomassiliicoccales archaeon]|nr:radical SAM protein [Methanomassiliicoccales archaeon]